MPSTRVMFFRPTLGDGGADRVTLTLLEELDRSRYDCTLVLVRREGALVDHVPRNIPVIELGSRRLAYSVPALARALRRAAPDTFMCTAGGANLVAIAAHRLARSRARLVLSERSALRRPGLERRKRLEIFLKRRSYPLADAVTAVSDGVARDLLEELRLDPRRVHVVYNPVVVPDLAAQASAPLDHPWFDDPLRPVLVAVGRLVAVKDYPTMLRAFVKLRDRHRARLAILGIGAERAALEARVTELGLAGDVQFVGFDPNPFRWMARGHVLLQSSVAEGLPGTLIQSMACGTPVVATDCDHGPREVVRDGIDGFLVRIGDAETLAERASRLLSDPALRAKMSSEASTAALRYTLESSIQRYQRVIDGVA